MDEFIFVFWGILGTVFCQVFPGGFALFVVDWLQDKGRLTRWWATMLATTGLMVAPTAIWMAATNGRVDYGIGFFQKFLIMGSLLFGPILGFFLHKRWLKAQG